MNAPTKRFARPRSLTKTEADALGYQAQGSYPSGLKNVRSYALRSTLFFADAVTETAISLFSKANGEQKMFDTNILQGNTVPNGQALLVHEIVFNLTTPAANFSQDVVNAFANFMRNTVFTFGRENAQWDAQFAGSEVLPSVFGMCNTTPDSGEAAPVRVGDFVKTGNGKASFRLRVPVVLGQNTSFNFTAQLRAALSASSPLVTLAENMTVELRGILTKMAAV